MAAATDFKLSGDSEVPPVNDGIRHRRDRLALLPGLSNVGNLSVFARAQMRSHCSRRFGVLSSRPTYRIRRRA
jgi:hypothetical protein